MEEILRGYESFESISLEITKMVSDMNELFEMYFDLTILQKVSTYYSTESAQDFIMQKFGLEADAATQQANTSKAEDPTTGGNVTGKDPNKDGKNKAATGSGIWKRLGG